MVRKRNSVIFVLPFIAVAQDMYCFCYCNKINIYIGFRNNFLSIHSVIRNELFNTIVMGGGTGEEPEENKRTGRQI